MDHRRHQGRGVWRSASADADPAPRRSSDPPPDLGGASNGGPSASKGSGFEADEAHESDEMTRMLGLASSNVIDSVRRKKKRRVSAKKANAPGFEMELALRERGNQLHDGAENDAEKCDGFLTDDGENCLLEDGPLKLDGENYVPSLFAKVLKPHQRRGVRFLWNHVVSRRGCILADYMGLGKTIQNLAVVHAFLKREKRTRPASSGSATVLIVTPSSVVRNWEREVRKWLTPATAEGIEGLKLLNTKVLDAVCSTTKSRVEVLSQWRKDGGVLIMGYEMFRTLVHTGTRSSGAEPVTRGHLLSPSAVILDEGHRLRHAKSQIVHALSQVKTPVRLVLTGYPMQNHLHEYHCMVDFARPGFLGTLEQFKHRFIIPIENGDASDADETDRNLAVARTFVLNEILRELVLRRDSSHLTKELPPKYEWLIRCRLTPLQAQLYRAFVRDKIRDAEASQSSSNGGIISAYHHSLAIVNHPDILYEKLARLQSGPSTSESATTSTESAAHKVLDLEADAVETTEDPAVQFDIVCRLPDRQSRLGGRIASRSFLDLNGERHSVICFEHIAPSGQLDGTVRQYDVIHAMDGVEILGQLDLVINMLQETKSGPNATCTLSIHRFHRSSMTMKCIRGETADQATAVLDDDVEVLDTVSHQASHALKYAEPLLREYGAEADIAASGKMRVLFAILRKSREVGDKVIVFSQSVLALDVIQTAIDKHNAALSSENDARERVGADGDCEGYLHGVYCGYARLDGSTPQSERNGIVDYFNTEDISRASVLLASTRAAGEGLNVHGANRVVMFDVCWNPCLDHEAMCRAYRVGQKKPVFVYRLIGSGTMERTVFDRQTKKEGLTAKVVDAKDTKRLVSTADLREFFNLKRFNRLQKTRLLGADAAARESRGAAYGSNPDTASLDLDENAIATRQALPDDSVLEEILVEIGDMITHFSLENLLVGEGGISGTNASKAREDFEKQCLWEKEYLDQGYPAAVAASMACQRLFRSFKAKLAQVEDPSATQRSFDCGVEAVACSSSGSSATRKVFHGVKFLVLRRRMEDPDKLIQTLQMHGGLVFLECGFQSGPLVVVSSWDLEHLHRWRVRQLDILKAAFPQMNESSLLFHFKTPQWVHQCVSVGALLEGYEPPVASISSAANSIACDSTALNVIELD